MLLLLSTLALAGYGDPIDGHPSWSDRDLHVWTNAARVAPDAFKDSYQRGDCRFDSFLADEQVGKPGLRWNHDLGKAARFHNNDMVNNGFFSHKSSDGTTFSDRLPRFYSGQAYGENIALGYSSSRVAMLEGWMCSDGHRSNIMANLFDEMGVAARAKTYTQDFGKGGVRRPGIAMANHDPQRPTSGVTIRADVWGDGRTPDAIEVVLDGEPVALDLAAGVAGLGLYEVELDTDGGCHTWYVEARFDDDVHRFPEDGSYGWGACSWQDSDAGWIDSQVEPEVDDPDPGTDSDTESDSDSDSETDSDTEDDGETLPVGSGCSTAPAPLAWLLLGMPVLVLRRKKHPCATGVQRGHQWQTSAHG
ncbi:MAG: Synergist-CTERM protein sorting domain-containing protein [Kiritimatiellia bacterium]|jgi:Synergist-CTERM protein sorting domain-containing protein